MWRNIDLTNIDVQWNSLDQDMAWYKLKDGTSLDIGWYDECFIVLHIDKNENWEQPLAKYEIYDTREIGKLLNDIHNNLCGGY